MNECYSFISASEIIVQWLFEHAVHDKVRQGVFKIKSE